LKLLSSTITKKCVKEVLMVYFFRNYEVVEEGKKRRIKKAEERGKEGK